MEFPNIDPVIFSIGPIELRWYGLMYVIGFFLAYFIIRKESKRKDLNYTDDDLYDFIFYLVLGVIIGGRLGYVIFYNLDWYLQNPSQIIMINKGGMSFHGGFLGVLAASLIYCRKFKRNWFELADLGALGAPLGLGFGRIGNFINGELYGRVMDPDSPLAPLGMVFPDGGPYPRHPSQLYESLFEGFIMFTILFILSRFKVKRGVLFGAFIMLYGTFRFFIEYTRQPDEQIGFVFAEFSMGQILCFPMILAGLALIIFAVSRKNKISEPERSEEEIKTTTED